MPIVKQGERAFEFEVTQGLLAFFDQHRIRTTNKKDAHRWKRGQVVGCARDARFYSHTMLMHGMHVTQLQSFSYALSPLEPFTRIGRYCSIAAGVRYMGVQHPTQYVTSSEILYRPNGLFTDTFAAFGAAGWQLLPNPQAVAGRIGHDVWIGQDVMLKKGISIGNGAVVAAGSIVTKDVLPYEIVGGVPARRIRMRFPAGIVEALSALAWWDYAIPQLPELPWGTPDEFIPALRGMIDSGQAKKFESDLGSVREIIGRTDG